MQERAAQVVGVAGGVDLPEMWLPDQMSLLSALASAPVFPDNSMRKAGAARGNDPCGSLGGPGQPARFLLSRGRYTTLDDPNAVGFTEATGINNGGQIVGEYFDANFNTHGFRLSGGQYTTTVAFVLSLHDLSVVAREPRRRIIVYPKESRVN
jgi:probable HAF family extracellular repeat protein